MSQLSLTAASRDASYAAGRSGSGGAVVWMARSSAGSASFYARSAAARSRSSRATRSSMVCGSATGQ
jgi:hypothetical protein